MCGIGQLRLGVLALVPIWADATPRVGALQLLLNSVVVLLTEIALAQLARVKSELVLSFLIFGWIALVFASNICMCGGLVYLLSAV
jgi:hypothetical protein